MKSRHEPDLVNSNQNLRLKHTSSRKVLVAMWVTGSLNFHDNRGGWHSPSISISVARRISEVLSLRFTRAPHSAEPSTLYVICGSHTKQVIPHWHPSIYSISLLTWEKLHSRANSYSYGIKNCFVFKSINELCNSSGLCVLVNATWRAQKRTTVKDAQRRWSWLDDYYEVTCKVKFGNMGIWENGNL